ncbi:hypothetical protein, partial [Roseisolibacter sp. H3M3-2]|uniref:hypothetical protein n=1 Tax=Roseisolibacter sp. H3M3-2 TaxID=3031323 RepID=UPI0023DB4025
YDNSFDSQADCNAFTTAHGSVDSATLASYDPLSYQAADGGYGLIDCNAGGGLWSDHNHIWPGPGMLNLLAVGNAAVNLGAIPNVADLRNARLTIGLRASDLFLPPHVRLALHFQVNDLAAPAGTGKPINFIFTGALIDDVLGFGGFGLGWPHLRDTGLTNSGFVTFTADLAPSDAFFQCIGTSVGRKDTYAAAPVARCLQRPLLNFMIVALYPQQDAALSMPTQRVSGALHINRFRIELPA